MFGNDGWHMLPVNSTSESPSWDWDENTENPTLSPSVLTFGYHGKEGRCHSFIRNGMIEFLGDCTHSLAGATVPLPEWS